MTGDECQIRTPIKYLQNQQSTCLRPIESLSEYVDAYQTTLQNTKLLRTHKNIDNHVMITEYCTSTDAVAAAAASTSSPASNNDCLPIFLFDCVDRISKSDCYRVNESNYDIGANRINSKIFLTFIHNFTNILNVSIHFVYTPASDTLRNYPTEDEIGGLLAAHTTVVQFLQQNESEHIDQQHHALYKVSGNIGYLQGKPIIAATMIPENTSVPLDKLTFVLDYFHPSNKSIDSHLIKLPTFFRNQCKLTRDTYETINFGENFYTKCDIRLNEDGNVMPPPTPANNEAAVNFTEICWKFQKKIFYYLLNYQYNASETYEIVPKSLKIFVSEFGNPRNDTNAWPELMLHNSVDGGVTGHYDKDDNELEFTCRNVVLNVRYEFHYASLMIHGAKQQRVIRESHLEFGSRVDLKFKLSEEMKVPIFIDVMFFDLTGNNGGGSSMNCRLSLVLGILFSLLICCIIDFSIL